MNFRHIRFYEEIKFHAQTSCLRAICSGILYVLSFGLDNCMGESFQDYSLIQDFEADFP